MTRLCLSECLPAPGGWGNSGGTQGTQDYAYFESGFATDARPLARQQRDTAVRPHPLAKRQRRIRRPTRDQKIQIFFNITGNGGEGGWLPSKVKKAHFLKLQDCC